MKSSSASGISSQNASRSDGTVAVSRHLEDERGAGGSPEAAPGDSSCRGPGRVELAIQRSEEHTSELQSLMRISYAVFCLKKKTTTQKPNKKQHKVNKE